MLPKSNWVIPYKLMAGACPRIGQEILLRENNVTVIVKLMQEKLKRDTKIDTSIFV